MSLNSRLAKLERSMGKPSERLLWVTISPAEWEAAQNGELELPRCKVYVGLDLDRWDDDDECTEPLE